MGQGGTRNRPLSHTLHGREHHGHHRHDESGAPYAMLYRNTAETPAVERWYYYVTNLQGDVVMLVNGSGTVVAEYSYDAWGKLLSQSGTLASTNPLRYRGYYYDKETKLYYLQSRYYDPEIGRFINADGLASTGQGILGWNMFAYCGNEPVGRSDKAGKRGQESSIWSFESDKQGRQILWHWLFGNGEDFIVDEGTWGQYMRCNPRLTKSIQEIVIDYADDLSLGETIEIGVTTSAEIENGESIIGYQYLHGTNANVGGFHLSGTISKDKSGDIHYDLDCTWNDIIDPNFKYTSDQRKAALAKKIPFANPTDYIIRISWKTKGVIQAV